MAAVVLTYNRKDLLLRCLAALSEQTRSPREIIVVDNASSDGTGETVAAAFPRVRMHRLSKNVGAAGGFNAAFAIGHRSGADFLWIMDDDVIPDPDALERLLDADADLAAAQVEAPFLISLARDPGGLVTNVPDVDGRRNALHYQNWPALLEHGLVPVRRSTFVSILVPRRTIDRHGLPIADMFMWGEDTEYTMRITQDKPGFLVGDSRVQHVRAASGKIDIRSETNPTRIGYHFHQIRNRIYISRRHGRPRAVASYAVRYLGLSLRLLASGETRKASVVARGVLSGLTFRPRSVNVEAAEE